MVKRSGGALFSAISFDPNSTLTLSSQLAAALRQVILEGALLPGERLPATRTLAGELSLARSTVVEAFEQLTSEGLVESVVGSGSFVAQLAGTCRIRPSCPERRPSRRNPSAWPA